MHIHYHTMYKLHNISSTLRYYAHVGFLYVSIKYAETALHVASGAGQSAVVTLLLDHRADIHAVTEEVTVVLFLVYAH